MWPKDAFGSSGGLQPKSHQNNYPSESGVPESGQYSAQNHSMTIQGDRNGESLNGSADDASFCNSGAFFQSQQNVGPSTQFSSSSPFVSPQIVAPLPSRPTSINARAAELRLQLLKSREARASSTTPASHTSIPGLSADQNPAVQPIGFVRQHSEPQVPTISHEDDISALISQLAPESKPPAELNIKPGYNQVLRSPLPQRPPTEHLLPQSLSNPPLGAPKATESAMDGDVAAKPDFAGLEQTSTSNRSPSGLSDGEIFEEIVTEPKGSSVQQVNSETTGMKSKSAQSTFAPLAPSNTSGDIRQSSGSQNSFDRGPQEGGPAYRPPVIGRQTPNHSQPQQSGTNRRESATELPQHQRVQHSDHKHASKNHSNPRHSIHSENDISAQDRREVQPVREQHPERREPDPKQAVDSLQKILLQNQDLREWLEHTGYHNIPYRNKILNARREIAALDAKRERLCAELIAEERHGFYLTPTPSTFPSSISNKADASTENSLTVATTAPSAYQEQIIPNKRRYSDIQDAQKEHDSEKAARFDDGPPTRRMREEGEASRGRPISRGMDTGPRISPDYRESRDLDRPQYEDFRFQEDTRMCGQDDSRERDNFPGPRGYESRTPERGRSYDRESLRDFDGDRPSRAFERRGNHRSKGFDPSYRGRGRARGRGRGDS